MCSCTIATTVFVAGAQLELIQHDRRQQPYTQLQSDQAADEVRANTGMVPASCTGPILLQLQVLYLHRGLPSGGLSAVHNQAVMTACECRSFPHLMVKMA